MPSSILFKTGNDNFDAFSISRCLSITTICGTTATESFDKFDNSFFIRTFPGKSVVKYL